MQNVLFSLRKLLWNAHNAVDIKYVTTGGKGYRGTRVYGHHEAGNLSGSDQKE